MKSSLHIALFRKTATQDYKVREAVLAIQDYKVREAVLAIQDYKVREAVLAICRRIRMKTGGKLKVFCLFFHAYKNSASELFIYDC